MVILSAVWLIAVRVLMLARPHIALQFLGNMASTNFINYAELSLRMIAGIAFVLYADLSRFPDATRIFGWFLAASSAVLFLVPRKWHAAYSIYWSTRLSVLLVRIFAPFPLVLGLFQIYAVM